MSAATVAPALTDVGERAEAARAWLGEFFADLDGDGGIRLAEKGPEGWKEYPRAVRPGQWDSRDYSREQVLDGLADALVAEADNGLDIFACPYAHHGPRRQGEAVARRHVHADIDGPLDLGRVRMVGGMALASGSTDAAGEPHGHVYVRLDREVTPEVHAALCAAVGRFVGGEHHDPSKVGDADVLRPAGTLNHKGGRAAPVRWLICPDDGGVKTWEPETLARLLGLGWPVPETGEAEDHDDQTEQTATAEGLAARLDGLARSVTDAPAGEGNGWLNWAAGVAGALCASATPDEDHDEVRADLVAAYLARPVPTGETAHAREREAVRTVASGWHWGTTHPSRALAQRHGDEGGDEDTDESETVSTTASTDGMADAAGQTAEDEAEFWEASPFYQSVLVFARARRVGPWALLGAVLAHASASVPPSVVLPPTIGGDASLNLFVALCSESGGGKSAAMVAARDFLNTDEGGGRVNYPVRSPGSGEGLLSQYVYVKREKGHAPEVVQRRLSVLFDVDEVGALGALAGRNGATLLPFLKTAWSGGDMGTANAEAERDRQVQAHCYRLALVAGVQPVNAGVILDDEGGGFPQRWLWMPTHDPGRRGARTGQREAQPWPWKVPGPLVTRDDENPDAFTVELRRRMPLPDEAVSAMLEAAEQRNRPIGAPLPAGAMALDGHALLTRAKVAALLALLHGREVVSPEDWSRAGVVLAVSDRTRAAVVAVRGKEAAKDDARKAARAGRSAAIAADAEATEKTARAVKVMLSALEKREGEHSESAVRRFAGSRYKGVADDALGRVAASGLVMVTERESTSGRREVTTYYRWAVKS